MVHVRSKDGAEGVSITNGRDYLHPILTRLVAPYFLGKDARDLDEHLFEVSDVPEVVLGVDWEDGRLGVPRRGRAIEEFPDPKEFLMSPSRRVSNWHVSYLTMLGECVSLECLREQETAVDPAVPGVGVGKHIAYIGQTGGSG